MYPRSKISRSFSLMVFFVPGISNRTSAMSCMDLKLPDGSTMTSCPAASILPPGRTTFC